MGSKIGALSDKKFNLILFTLVTVASVFYVFYLHKELDGGFVAGADWNVPATKQQYERALEIFTSTWSDSWYLGLRNSTHTNLWYIVFTYILSRVFTNLTYIPLIVIAMIQALALLTTFHFLRDIGVSRLGGLVGGIFLATSPIMFNYLIMGWIYVLFAFSFLSLSLIFIKKSLETQRLSFSAAAGVFFGLSLAQSQAILWLPLVVTSYVLAGGFTAVSLKRKFLSILIYMGVGLLINAPTITNLVFYPNQALLDPKILTSGASLGASIYTTPVNIIRLYGSNFNKPYENTQNTMVGVFLSFLLPILIAVFLVNKDIRVEKKYLPFLLLFFTSALSLLLDSNRELLKIVPGGAVFRDTARFSFVSTFASAVLLGLAIDSFRDRKGLTRPFGISVVILLLYTTTKPWLEGELTKQPIYPGADVRLRGINYPHEYNEVEELLKSKGKNFRALYLPANGILRMENNTLFSQPYRELADVYVSYSPIPGGFYINDRALSGTSDIINWIYEQLRTDHQLENLDSILKKTSTKYIVIRKAAYFPQKAIIQQYVDARAKILYNGVHIEVYELDGTHPLIHGSRVNEEGDRNKDTRTDTTVKKLHPYEYGLVLSSNDNSVDLRFTETYDDYWVLELESIPENTRYEDYVVHYKAEGYCNGWYINLGEICKLEKACKEGSGGVRKVELKIIHNTLNNRFLIWTADTIKSITSIIHGKVHRGDLAP